MALPTPEQVNELIHERRSIFPKFYTGEPVDEAIIRQLLENANWAPTHKFTEPWRFQVFTGAALERIFTKMADMYPDKATKLLGMPEVVSHLIAIIMHRDPNQAIPEVEEIAAVSCAVQNMYLTATAYDLGAYWSTGNGTYSEVMKQYLGLGEHDRLMGFFFVGHHNMKNPKSIRKPIEDKVTWVRE
ncbi:Nitroreductase [Catalinimonas alkaloidigena]|uniref:Putative NAD(P)H nitroreductase n=1 Tax=Catalinimonas alkaloidigena TaxID=1075417 RepID=A0A1G9JGH2_9BACT|nr:nitroreductase [Catalinimonas alkaloidigena]SDL36392.1 Nitroreductase [Catalinimonas alkaloidigena]